MRKIVLGLGLVASALSTLAAGPAAAAAGPAPGLAWGVVDMERVAAEDRGRQALTQQFQDFQRQQDAELQRYQKSRMLSDEERREYLDRSSPTAAPTPERDQRLAELEKLSDDRSRRLLDLEKKISRTPEEDQEYQRLDQTYKQRMQEISALQSDAQKAVLAKYDQFTKLLADSLSGAVKAVAEEKKLSMILVKETVLFGGLDVTNEVIAKLNSTPLPAPAMPVAAPAGVKPQEAPAGKPAG